MGFFEVSGLEQPLKFLLNSLPSLLTSPRDDQSQARIREAFPTGFYYEGRGERESLKFCNASGRSQKFYSYSKEITKNLQNLLNVLNPLPLQEKK